jgi:hypothetical protein
VRQLTQPKTEPSDHTEENQPEPNKPWQDWEQQLNQIFGLPVKLSVKARGNGKVEIAFSDEESLVKLIKKLS